MEAQARSLVLLPRIIADTNYMRDECSPFDMNAPSHAPLPATDLLYLKLSLVISLDTMVTTFSLQVTGYPG